MDSLSPLKPIRVGIPLNFNTVGDTFLMTPLARHANVTWEIPVDTFCASDLGSILSSVANIEYTKEPITEEASFRLYGVEASYTGWSGLHATRYYLSVYGFPIHDCIPSATPPQHEIDWAQKFLSHYRAPICFSPIPGGLRNANNTHARSKYVIPEWWEPTLRRLKDSHDILYFTAKDNYIPFPYATPMLGFPIAKIAAVQHLTKSHLGVENGLLHLGVAMGVECRVGIPVSNINNESLVPYLYSEDMWIREPNRVAYAPITGPGMYVKNLMF